MRKAAILPLFCREVVGCRMAVEPMNHEKDQVTPFAITNYRDIKKRFGIKTKNRQGHMYVIGKTGTGKSTLLKNMVISDIHAAKGVCLIDPHGDLAEDVLHFVPKRRLADVIYFNPQDIEHPVAFNLLDKVEAKQRFLVASGLIAGFKKIWSDFWGPRLEHILRYSLLTLLEQPGSTLLDVPRLLTHKAFRQSVLTRVTNQQVREFWLLEFDKYSARLQQEAISPILNKIGQFLASVPLRNIVGQRENTFEVRKAMDERKILIVNLAKGSIGEDVASLLGAMMVTKIQLAALSRSDLPPVRRRSFYLYVDEIHNFLTLSFADILSEARKYGLNMILAHQYIEQLDEKVRSAIFGNVGTLISFRVGAEDAFHLAREFYPFFGQEDFVNLPNYHIYLKLLIDGVVSHPFSAITLPSPDQKKSYAQQIIALSREQFARPQKAVESQILWHTSPQSRMMPFDFPKD